MMRGHNIQNNPSKGKADKNTDNIIRLKSEQCKDTGKLFPFYEAYHDTGYIDFHDKRKSITLKDKGHATYILTNDVDKELVCYNIDGKLINDADVAKCDFGIYTQDDTLILIELKGSDYGHAIDQINSTIDILIQSKKINISSICGRVVLNRVRVPDTLETKEKKLKRFLKDKYNGTLEKCSLKMQECLSTI